MCRPKVRLSVRAKQIIQMLKAKTMPNKTTTEKRTKPVQSFQKMSRTLFLQHVNGFISHRTFVVCQEKNLIIFLNIKSNFIIRVFLLFC